MRVLLVLAGLAALAVAAAVSAPGQALNPATDGSGSGSGSGSSSAEGAGCNKHITLVVDTSGSIGSLGTSVRSTFAMLTRKLLERGARVSSVAFASNATELFRLVRKIPEEAGPFVGEQSNTLAELLKTGGSTNLLDAMDLTEKLLKDFKVSKVASTLKDDDHHVFVLTDGAPNRNGKPTLAADIKGTAMTRMFGPSSEQKAHLRVLLFGAAAQSPVTNWPLNELVQKDLGGAVNQIPKMEDVAATVNLILDFLKLHQCFDIPEARVYFKNAITTVFNYQSDDRAFHSKWMTSWRNAKEALTLCTPEKPGQFIAVGFASKSGSLAVNEAISKKRAFALACHLAYFALPQLKCYNYKIELKFGGEGFATLPENAGEDEAKVDRYVALYADPNRVPAGVKDLSSFSNAPSRMQGSQRIAAESNLPDKCECSKVFDKDYIKILQDRVATAQASNSGSQPITNPTLTVIETLKKSCTAAA